MIHLYDIPTKCGLEIFDLETFCSNVFPDKTNPLQCNSFLIVWVQQGKGFYYVDLEKHAIKADTIYCSFPGQVHVFNDCEFTKGYVLSLKPEYLNPLNGELKLLLNSSLFINQSIKPIGLCINTKIEIEQLMHSIIKENMGVSEFKTEMLCILLKLFLMHLIRKAGLFYTEHLQINRDTNLAFEFLDMVQQHFMTLKKVSDYAEKLCTTPNSLNTKVKKVTGFTTSYHIQQRIIMEAKRQALWGKMNSKEIAYMLGYDDLSHFSKFFKIAAGTNFTDFKTSFRP